MGEVVLVPVVLHGCWRAPGAEGAPRERLLPVAVHVASRDGIRERSLFAPPEAPALHAPPSALTREERDALSRLALDRDGERLRARWLEREDGGPWRERERIDLPLSELAR